MISLKEFLADLEFDYIVNNDNTISLIDELRANLGNIEAEKYIIDENLASFLVDRLDTYIYDYHISGIEDTLRHQCQYKDDIYPYNKKLIKAMHQYPDIFDNNLIEYIDDIIKANIDISELDYVCEITKLKNKLAEVKYIIEDEYYNKGMSNHLYQKLHKVLEEE